MDPMFLPQAKLSGKNTGCTGGIACSRNSSVKQSAESHRYLIDEDPYNTSVMSSSLLDIDEYKKMKKRMQNKESAVRSRMKKKAYYETVEVQF